MEIQTLTDEQLDALRIEVATEQERRQRVAQLPGEIATMTRTACEAGVTEAEIRTAVEDVLAAIPAAPAAQEATS